MSRRSLLGASILCLWLLAGACGANPFGGHHDLRPGGWMHTAALPTHYVLERTIGAIPSWHPVDLCVDGDGYVYVLDGQASMVRKLAPASTTVVRSWGGVGSDNGKFREPRSITVDSFGYVYVLDRTLHSIQKFTRQGLFIKRWAVSVDAQAICVAPATGQVYCTLGKQFTSFTANGNSLLTFTHSGSHADDIALDEAGNTYILDSEPAIYKYNAAGTFLSKLVSGPANHDYLQDACLTVGGGKILVGGTDSDGMVTVYNSTTGALLNHYVPFGGDDGQGIDGSHGIALDSAGNFYVGDLNTARIQRLSPTGIYQYKWGWGSALTGQFRGPTGVAVDTAGNIFVVDTLNRRVQEFNSSGVWQRTFGGSGTTDGKFTFPIGVAVSGTKLYVGDMRANRIQRFNTATGAYEAKFGSTGAGNGQFNGPTGLVVAASGNIYVVDQGNHRVQYFNAATGVYLGQFGAATLQSPWGVAISGTQVFVADENLHKVYPYSLTGVAAGSWGSSGDLYGKIGSAKSMASDSGGKLWLADWDNGWVQQFSTTGVAQNVIQMADAKHPWLGDIMGVATGPSSRVYMTDLIYQQVYVFKTDLNPAPPRSVVIGTLSAAPTSTGVSIGFTLSAAADATVEIANIAGRTIRQISMDGCSAGTNVALWDGRANSGLKTPAGMYLVKLTARSGNGAQASCLTQVTLGR